MRDTQARTTRPLQLNDLQRLARAMREPAQPATLFDAVAAVAAETIGFRLFTIMAYDARNHEVERVFTNMPTVYPNGGRKKKHGTAWATQILLELQPFRGETAHDIRNAFDDHMTMANLGLGSILNIPIAYDGECIGTMNLTHVEHWYTREHEDAGMLLGSFLAPALVSRLPLLADEEPRP
ncbi:GAF domain-containing protein [Caballeronia sp. J97]|uniref:GAF domain-containing protein n=1 Tax=Caballeronia sp. J97 TaxID=2805429 RepID=UPI002AB2F577|nr:GAF domain-containing protein [Caballeronia sp. J97]